MNKHFAGLMAALMLLAIFTDIPAMRASCEEVTGTTLTTEATAESSTQTQMSATTASSSTTAHTTAHTTASTTSTTSAVKTTTTTYTQSSQTTATKPAAPEDGRDITAQCTITPSENGDKKEHLLDGSIKTVWQGKAGASITVTSTWNIGSLYIVWDHNDVPWTIHGNKDAESFALASGGTNGFLHEYVPLSQTVNSLTLTLYESAGSIAGLYVFAPGQVPVWVQQWQPMLDKADMLVYSTHADDELLWLGGTLPVYAGEYKRKVQVAYLIHHGKSRNEYCRNHELLDGLWTVGVKNYPMLSQFEDYYASNLKTAKEKYDEKAVLSYTVMLLRRFRPDVVVGQDLNGEYGHGVHMLCSQSMQQAISLSSDGNIFPLSAEQYGLWHVRKCYFHLYSQNPVVMNWETPLKAFGGKTGMEMARLGYQCHKSQLSKWFKVADKGSPYDGHKFGLYYSAVGEDVEKNDFFEHVDGTVPVFTTSTTTATHSSEGELSDETTQPLPVLIAPTGVQNNPSGLPTEIRWLLGLSAILILVAAGFVLWLIRFHKHPQPKAKRSDDFLSTHLDDPVDNQPESMLTEEQIRQGMAQHLQNSDDSLSDHKTDL